MTTPTNLSPASALAPPSRNPFSTRDVRPGAVDYLFESPGDRPESLVARLAEQGWWGEIVGPHGSGKSTLLASLLPALTAAGAETTVFTLRDGQSRLPGRLPAGKPRSHRQTLIVVDGYEQLGRLARWGLRRACRRQGWGLIVTAHDSVGFPRLFTTSVTRSLARRLVVRLAGAKAADLEREVESCFTSARGNMREALFALYDVYERRRSR